MNLHPSNHNFSAATCRQNAFLAGGPESCTALTLSSLNWPLCFAVFFFLGFFSVTSLTCSLTPLTKHLSTWGGEASKGQVGGPSPLDLLSLQKYLEIPLWAPQRRASALAGTTKTSAEERRDWLELRVIPFFFFFKWSELTELANFRGCLEADFPQARWGQTPLHPPPVSACS